MASAAFFDLDGTLVCGESQFSFLVWCLRRRIAPRIRALPVLARYASYLAGCSGDALKLRESGFRLFRGIPLARIEESAKEFFHSALATRFRRQAVPLIEAFRASGHVIVLITSACEPVAGPVASMLHMDVLLSTRLIAHGGSLTGERELPEPYGSGKCVLVKSLCEEHQLNPRDCFAFTDHHSDASLLDFVGHPVAVNPTRKLRSIAGARGWPVLDLDAPELPGLELSESSVRC